MRKFILLSILLFSLGNFVHAQEEATENRWSLGIGGGFHTNSMKFSNLDEDIFPSGKNMNSGVFSVFVQYELGKERQFAIRPEIAFLRRGGKLTEIDKASYDEDISDVNYTLKSGYLDIRMPLIYSFGKANSTFRPYLYVAPVFGFSTTGDIRLQQEYNDGTYFGYAIDLSKANMATTYLAGAVGLGAKYQFKVSDNTCFLGLEASYEHGFTDTYGKKEKDGEAIVNSDLFPTAYKINGTRKFSGFEVKATLGIPFSVFKKKQPAQPQPEPVVAPPVRTPVISTPVVEEKSCYTLEEIIDLMARGERVEGKTICAIDAINFDFGKSSIKRESHKYLDKLAATLTRTNARIEVKGHTDNVGSEEFNMNLSKERAQSVVNYLIGKGVSKDKLSYSYYGMSKPLTTNDTEEGRTMNRRVEFEILR